MKILTVNAGSSSLKFSLFEMPEQTVLASGLFEKIGLEDSLYTIKYNGSKKEVKFNMPDMPYYRRYQASFDLPFLSFS